MLMATFVVLSALPAFAAADSIDVVCTASNDDPIFGVRTGERPRNDLGAYRRDCKDEGGRLTLTVFHEPEPPSETPPCCGPEGAKP